MKICVLAGGLSPERDVSLSSGALIANALVQNGHSVALIDLFLGVSDANPAVWSDRADFSYKIPEAEPDLKRLIEETGRDSQIGAGVIEACAQSDVTFLALHGGIGENGMLQAVLECSGIRFTGSDSAGCMLAMDKDISKRLVRAGGINTADWIIRPVCEPSLVDEALDKVGLPCVVKPLSCGSSVGVSLVKRRAELEQALRASAVYEKRVLIERLVEGREFSVGILDGRALPPIEIRPKAGFYDYKNKYQSGLTEELCPAPLTEEQTETAMDISLKVHGLLNLGSYSRVDLILDKITGQFVFLEVNALPGMTPISLLPQEAKADGIDYNTLCDLIVRCALNKG